MNPFAERHKTLSNADLLKIIDNAGDYQSLAVEAAKIELSARHLSEEDMAGAVAENEALIQEEQIRYEKKKAFGNKVKDISASFIDTIHPIQQTPPSANRTIAILSIVFALLFLFEFFNDFAFLKFTLTSKYAKRSFEMIFYFLPLLVFPIAAFLFWRRRKAGWVLLCIYASFTVISSIGLFVVALGHRSMAPVPFLWAAIFYGGCMWLLCKKSIREIYAIDSLTMFSAAGFGALLTAIMIFVVMR